MRPTSLLPVIPGWEGVFQIGELSQHHLGGDVTAGRRGVTSSGSSGFWIIVVWFFGQQKFQGSLSSPFWSVFVPDGYEVSCMHLESNACASEVDHPLGFPEVRRSSLTVVGFLLCWSFRSEWQKRT